MSNHSRTIVGEFENDRFKVLLFDTGNMPVLLKKGDNWFEDFKSSAIMGKVRGGSFEESKGSLMETQGLSRFVNFTEASYVFKNKTRLKKMLAAVEAYTDFMGWDKTRDGEGYKLTLPVFRDNVINDYVLNLDRDPVDIWAIYSSLSINHFSGITLEKVASLIEHQPYSFKELVGENKDNLIFEDSASYLTPSAPVYINAMRDFNRLAKAVAIMNAEGSTRISELDLESVPVKLENCHDAGVREVIENSLNGSRDFSGKSSLTNQDFLGMTKDEFIQFYTVSHGFGFNETGFRDLHFVRVKDGLKFNHELNRQTKDAYSPTERFKKRLTYEEYEAFDRIYESNKELANVIMNNVHFFVKFVNNVSNMEVFAHDFEASMIYFNEVTGENKQTYISASKFLDALEHFDRYQELFDKYLEDPTIPFSLLMRIEGIVQEGDSRIYGKRNW